MSTPPISTALPDMYWSLWWKPNVKLYGKEYYSRHMKNVVYVSLRGFQEFIMHKLSEKHVRPKQLFLATSALEFIIMDILRPLWRTLNGHQLVLVIKIHYWKFQKSVQTSRRNPFLVFSKFMGNWVFPYGVPEYVLTDNGISLPVRSLRHCAHLWVQNL